MGHRGRIKAGRAVALFLALHALPAAGPAAGASGSPGQERERSFGPALPPIGFVAFCARNPGACDRRRAGLQRPAATRPFWNLLMQVNRHVNAAIAPASDQELYGVAEYWAYPRAAGDCEDYVLLKQRYLEALGIARSALLVTVVLDERNQGHAVLTVTTAAGDLVLDNRSNAIRLWSETGYVFLKRQSAGDPRQWESLAEGPSPGPSILSGGTGG